MADIHPTLRHLTERERFGTQTRVAEAAGVKPHTISGRRGGRNPLTFAQMERILREAPRMGVAITPDDFFPHIGAKKSAA